MEDFSCDVLIIGGGNAALCAALCARENHQNVIVLETSPKDWRGGNSQHTRNLRSMHIQPTDVLSDSYSEDEFWEDVWRVSGGETNEEYARFVISQTPQIIQWAKSHGVRFQPSLGGTLQLGRTNAFFLGGGKALLNAYYKRAEQLGIKIFYEHEAIDLHIQEDECKYILVKDKIVNKVSQWRAKTYIVASGGFESNLDWLKEAWGQKADNFLIRGTKYNQGLMLKALIKEGAKILGSPTQGHMVAIDARAPKYDGGIVSRVDCVSLGIVVNKNAKRFYDEGEDFWPKRYAIWGRLVANQPEEIAYSITDSKVLDKYMPSLFPPIIAESISDLAKKLKLDEIILKQTLNDYNQKVVAGNFNHTILDDCKTKGLEIEKTHWAQKIDTPPFYCYPLRPGITFTYLGVGVTKQAEVIKQNGEVCKNLFAAGEIMAGNILSKGYVAGFGMSIGSVFGRIAGISAANFNTKRGW
ncbi:FAD-dependent tricarballylate dehydrogenase TcuA [Helicobacter sp. 11S03491-1]|uniref:FAD-dependent tricarballylate dehydrogenase TcuA n=1 Tax=Helicobacter sp. 11S03491-1 TaxID=1476196 RepID=UPI000BA78A10|nr:FAD-dependent tricarballylate dehydrogenase TcuA [Helicobacter sp. 11S03491-1]PAF42213.1 FAD-binding dehydrogenase [Helicobacter sp. 11S03491-1]